MTRMTITEALAKLKTIDKRLEKKREFILTYLIRQDVFRDPLDRDGGSADAIRRELQSIRDMEERKVSIRRAIQQANSATAVTVGQRTRTIADWLVWRREVMPAAGQFLSSLRAKIDLARQEVARHAAVPLRGADPGKPPDIVVNMSEQELSYDVESLEEILGTLDGQLSLRNATLFVEIESEG